MKAFPLLLSLGAALVAAGPRPLEGQGTPGAVAVAERLQQEGRYADAADTLLRHLETHPDDAGVHWWAAQLLNRAGRTEAAAREYEAAVTLTPADPWLRVEYAELLMSLVALRRAQAVALPLAEDGNTPDEARARALTVLGTVAYWRGDLAAAVDRFEAAVAVSPDQSEALRQLYEIRAATRSWARLSLMAMDDNQPYRRGRAELEVGAFLNPLWTAAVELTPHLLDPPAHTGLASATRGPAEARGTLTGFLPAARLDVTGGFGGVRQDETTWVGHAGLGLRLPGEISLEGRAERERYLWTTASADTLVMLESGELVLERAAHPGWAGEAVARLESFRDGNRVATVYAWLLAPVVPGLRLGGAASWQDAEESRWQPDTERYTPYFTPLEQRVVSALAEVVVSLGSATARLNGNWGVWAREEAPGTAVSVPGNPPGRGAVRRAERSYTPWSVVAALDVPAGERISLRFGAERQRTAFYQLTRGDIGLRVVFGSPSPP